MRKLLLLTLILFIISCAEKNTKTLASPEILSATMFLDEEFTVGGDWIKWNGYGILDLHSFSFQPLDSNSNWFMYFSSDSISQVFSELYFLKVDSLLSNKSIFKVI